MELAICFDLGHEDDNYDVVGVYSVLWCIVLWSLLDVDMAVYMVEVQHALGMTVTAKAN